MRILVVEDDDILRDGLDVGLRLAGFSMETVATLEDARAALAAGKFDVVVLDLMLPDGSGLDLLDEIRRAGSDDPVLLLTARDKVEDRIVGLDHGADDYLVKPFDLDELAARLRALVRRVNGRAQAYLVWDQIRIVPATMELSVSGTPAAVSRREFAVLQSLMEAPMVIQSKRSLEEKLYGWQEDIDSNAIEVHIHHLRQKIGRDAIETVRGLGYRMRKA
ncbi:response regulator [Devosia sp.]|uniref:response regulator n=1 Tax=Devosia sp. TaxID=1871048 RepID=UPI0027368766|nr:response regulator [Devosia sp.]MDP2779150.1 response regulator [Devosia sp.]